jgi:hypothetical protein
MCSISSSIAQVISFWSFAIATNNVWIVLDEQSVHQTSTTNFKTQKKAATSPLSLKKITQNFSA